MRFVVPDYTAERAATMDGVLLGMRRYARAGAQPVLLLHGLAQNLNGWDLPVRGHSLARWLSAHGFDVWLGNFRGHGRAPHRSGTGGRPARIDDYGVHDVPAFIERVERSTGRRPLIIGHSMGGIATLIHLMGSSYDDTGRVEKDARLAAERNDALAGVVLVAVPPALAWHRRPGLRVTKSDDWHETSPLLQLIVARSAVRQLLDRLPLARIPVGALASLLTKGSDLPGPAGIGPAGLTRVLGQAVSAALAHTLWHPGNMNPALVDAETRYTLDDTSVPVLRQFCDWIAHGTAREFTVDGPRAPFVYADHLSTITTPVLLVAGEHDRVAPASVMRSRGLTQLGSVDRAFLVLRDFGHNDLRVGVRAPTTLYPAIGRWLRERAGSSAARRVPRSALLNQDAGAD